MIYQQAKERSMNIIRQSLEQKTKGVMQVDMNLDRERKRALGISAADPEIEVLMVTDKPTSID